MEAKNDIEKNNSQINNNSILKKFKQTPSSNFTPRSGQGFRSIKFMDDENHSRFVLPDISLDQDGSKSNIFNLYDFIININKIICSD